MADPYAAAVFEAWQEWAPVGPDELAASMKVTAAAEVDRPASVDVYGALLGTESDVTELLDELVVRAGSGSDLDVGRADVLRRRGSSGRNWVLPRTGMSPVGKIYRRNSLISSLSRSSSTGRCLPKPAQH